MISTDLLKETMDFIYLTQPQKRTYYASFHTQSCGFFIQISSQIICCEKIIVWSNFWVGFYWKIYFFPGKSHGNGIKNWKHVFLPDKNSTSSMIDDFAVQTV